ncbi:MAG: DNA/RNA nuclease SfsA [Lawsonibacter sp.]|jgi:sugar fermentation stimulation protein A
MQYPNYVPGRFLARPNRFVAQVEIEGVVQVCHVKNTGRCKELLVPGCRVYLTKSANLARKTQYDLVAVEKETNRGMLQINLDAQAPNRVFGEWAEAGGFRDALTLLRPETTYRNSRFDYYWECSDKRGFVEIKGVTLEANGVARFPDAPTQRGVRHLEELIMARQEGYEAALCFVVQMEGMKWVEPNDVTHPQFGATLRRAAQAGVEILGVECKVWPDALQIVRRIPVHL